MVAKRAPNGRGSGRERSVRRRGNQFFHLVGSGIYRIAGRGSGGIYRLFSRGGGVTGSCSRTIHGLACCCCGCITCCCGCICSGRHFCGRSSCFNCRGFGSGWRAGSRGCGFFLATAGSKTEGKYCTRQDRRKTLHMKLPLIWEKAL